MKTILIVGSTGTIGSYLLTYLTQKKYSVWGISRGPASSNKLSLDMMEIESVALSRILTEKKIDVIIHCVASLKPKNPEDMIQAGLVSSKLLLNNVGRTKQHIIFGSAAEYGLQDCDVLDETTPLLADTDYGLSKLLQTEVALRCIASYGIQGVILRLSNIISPLASQKSFIHKLLAQIQKPHGKEVSINDYRIERDFIDIRDVAAIVERFLEMDAFDTVYNVSCGKNMSYRKLIQEINAVLKGLKKPPLRIIEGDRTEPFNTATLSNKKLLHLIGPYQFHSIRSSFSWCIEEVLQNK